ncbi:hypothetical protein CDD82_5751 [Ophiocordyceps australis]|uniref:Uncharacterized protein n=1 Tax=Ophiocordyceps australis TaxID=1399860 RepID=A0A2C5YZU3_9HYPO|nr:hypothetical protein CDD82_5751 [Ophiocordyceps australis]
MLQYPPEMTLFPLCFGRTMMARIQLRLIVNDLCARLYSKSSDVPEFCARALAEFKLRLRQWYTSLSDRLQTRMIVLPSELKLQQQQALHQRPVSQSSTLATGLQPGPTPDEQLALSRLETIMRLYYLRHGFDSFDAYMTYFFWLLADASLLNSAYGTIQDDRDLSALQSNLVLSLKGLGDQGRILLVARVTMHILRDRITAEDMKVVKEHLRWDPSHQQEPSSEALMRSQWGNVLEAFGGDLRQTVVARSMGQM